MGAAMSVKSTQHTVLQAEEGADLDFLVGCRGAFVPRDKH